MKKIYIFSVVLIAMFTTSAQTSNYSIGNFQFRVVINKGVQPQITVTNKAEPKRILWQTVPGVALIGAATGIDFISMHGIPEGSFTVIDKIVKNYTGQTISGFTMEGDQLVMRGQLSSGGDGVNYSLAFRQVSTNQLQYQLTTSGPGAKSINRLFLRLASPADEHFYGFGEQLTYFDQKGNVIPVLVQEHGIGRGLPVLTQLVDLKYDFGGGNPYVTCAPAPQYITSKLNSLFLENKQYSVFDLHNTDRLEIKLFSDTLTGRIVYGKTPLDLIKEYTSYCGRMRALPDWTNNGAIVSLQHGTDSLKAKVALMDKAGIPIAALWVQDWTGGRITDAGYQLWWNWQLSDSTYPGWVDYVKQLRDRNIRMMTYINPFLVNSTGHNDLYQYALKHDFLVKKANDSPYMIHSSNFSAALIDLSNPGARVWIKSKIVNELITHTGASGWMADFAEALPYDAKLYNNAPTSYWHNHYTEMWAQVNREAITEAGRQDDILFFNRSGFTQSPGQSTLFWLGDQLQTWDQFDGIKTAVVGMLSGGMSGFSMLHGDIGGYNCFTDTILGKAFTIARNKELLWRWEELGIFNPVFRTHEGLNPKISAQFYDDDETIAHFARSVKMFKALSFYRKELVKQASVNGYPIIRHPFIQFPTDTNTYSLRYQFMYGSEFMVAPVLDPGATSVSLYLPTGNWINLWTNQAFNMTTGGWITVAAPIGQPAMFYQKGSKVADTYIKALKDAGVYPAAQPVSVLRVKSIDETGNNIVPALQASVYPNPVVDAFTLRLKNTQGEAVQLALTDINGKMLATTVTYNSEMQMRLDKFPAGIYIMKVSTQQKTIAIEMVKN